MVFVVLGVIGMIYYGTAELPPGDDSGRDNMAMAVILAVVGILVGLWEHGRAVDYEQAAAAYRRRRKEAESRYCAETKTED